MSTLFNTRNPLASAKHFLNKLKNTVTIQPYNSIKFKSFIFSLLVVILLFLNTAYTDYLIKNYSNLHPSLKLIIITYYILGSFILVGLLRYIQVRYLTKATRTDQHPSYEPSLFKFLPLYLESRVYYIINTLLSFMTLDILSIYGIIPYGAFIKNTNRANITNPIKERIKHFEIGISLIQLTNTGLFLLYLSQVFMRYNIVIPWDSTLILHPLSLITITGMLLALFDNMTQLVSLSAILPTIKNNSKAKPTSTTNK